MKLFSSLGSQSLTLQKNAPNLLFFGGVAGMIGTTVMASMATLKLQDVLQEAEDLKKKCDDKVEEELKHFQQDPRAEHEKREPKYTKEDAQKDHQIITAKTAVKVVKLYAPAVALGVASVGMLSKSHNLLAQRNAALTAAYVALDKGFREYRERVIEKYGEEEDQKFRYASEKVTAVKEKDGTKRDVYRVTPEAASIYARFFDQLSSNWSKEPEYNRLFLRSQQNYFNDLLNARGHVFLNEVYDGLDIPRSEAGSIVGWYRGENSDSFISFGVFEGQDSDLIRDFMNGREGSVLLDFNVDGVIYNLIDTPREAPSWQKS